MTDEELDRIEQYINQAETPDDVGIRLSGYAYILIAEVRQLRRQCEEIAITKNIEINTLESEVRRLKAETQPRDKVDVYKCHACGILFFRQEYYRSDQKCCKCGHQYTEILATGLLG